MCLSILGGGRGRWQENTSWALVRPPWDPKMGHFRRFWGQMEPPKGHIQRATYSLQTGSPNGPAPPSNMFSALCQPLFGPKMGRLKALWGQMVPQNDPQRGPNGLQTCLVAHFAYLCGCCKGSASKSTALRPAVLDACQMTCTQLLGLVGLKASKAIHTLDWARLSTSFSLTLLEPTCLSHLLSAFKGVDPKGPTSKDSKADSPRADALDGMKSNRMLSPQ